MSTYGSLLKTRGVGRIIAAQLVARFPGGMLSLAFLMHVERIHESYGAAGLVLAATSIGQAVAGPLTSRRLGVWGMRPVLILTSVVCTVAVVAVALGDESTSVPVFMVLGLVAGLANPPVQPAVRTIYPKMVNSKQLTPLFSLDASAQEIIWVLGPVIATFLAIQVDTSAGILVAAAFLVGGGAWFISSPELARVRIPRSKRRFGVVLGRPPVLLSTVVGFLLIAACSAIEAGVVAVYGHGGPEAGFVLAIFAVGSLIGGLSLGHIPISPWAMARRLTIILVGTALAAVWMQFAWLSVFLFLAGVGIAPALAVLFAVVSSRCASATPRRPTAGSAPGSSSAPRSDPPRPASSSSRRGRRARSSSRRRCSRPARPSPPSSTGTARTSAAATPAPSRTRSPSRS